MEYKGYTIGCVGTNLTVTGKGRTLDLVPKEEGKTFEACAKQYIDRLEGAS